MTHTHNQMRFAAAAAMLLFAATGCLKENFYDPSDVTNGPRIVATIDEAAEDSCETRMSVSMDETSPTGGKLYLYWNPEDEIGVFTDASESNVRFRNTASENAKTVTFAPTSAVSGTPAYAYYPYSAEAGTNMTAIKGHISSAHTLNAELDNVPGVYRYGYYKSTSGNASSFGFKHVFSIVRFHLDVTGTKLAGRQLQDIEITVKRGSKAVPVCGDFTFNAETGAHTIGSNTSNTIKFSFDGQPVLDDEITFYTTLFSNVKKNDVLYFTVNTAGYTATYRVSSNVAFAKNNLYTYSMPIRSYSSLRVVENEIGKPDPSELPTINSFSFEVGKNSGKLLNNELKWNSSKHTSSFSSVSSHTADIDNDTEQITLTIPYLYDFKLKPTFSVASGCVVTVDGVEQKSGESEVDFTRPVTYTVTNSENGYSRDYKVKITNTGLPVVVINQSTSGDFSKKYNGGFNIGSTNIGGTLVNQFVDFMIRGKDTSWASDDQITVYNPDGTIDCSVTGGVRLRGNTTQVYPKKPFAVKFNEKKSVLGMPKHKRWVLLANWLDHSMIRNTVAFDIAQAVEYAWRQSGGAIGDGIPWSVHGQNVELVFIENGEAHHVGNYYLCEQIKIDENRLNIRDSYEDVLSTNMADCGYLLEFDMKEDEDTKYTTSNGAWVKFKDDAIAGTSLFTAVCDKIQDIEDYLDAGNYTEAYKLLDINSLVDQFLIWELTMNREYGDPGSVYMFMDGDGKLCAGPVWDFDRGTFQNQEKATSLGNSTSYRVKPDNEWMFLRSQESEAYSYIWYRQLMKDATFQQTVQQRWAVIKPYLDMVPELIRYYGETQAVSFSYDSVMWPTNYGDVRKYKSDFKDWSGDEEIASWDEVVNNFVTVYTERLEGMNSLITSGQFSK